MLADKIKGKSIRIAISVVDGDTSELDEFATVGVLRDQPTNTPFVFRAQNASDMVDIIHYFVEAVTTVIRWQC